MSWRWTAVVCLVSLVSVATADDFIPRAQDRPPGPALSPDEALAKMTVPEGFQVELVASEPQIVNPVAMTFDERGRIWVTESFEYPRREPGPGRDRVKVLEDTDHDGRVDKVTVFAEGLNIPSGIAVGYGGVWVANSPDILFLQDTDGDGKADKSEVVVTGFGRDDTHELPNSLTWGPDGWLYGLNGVFNFSHVKHKGKEYKFTCALFRIHPRTRDFELFCEGTSNPWGVAFDTEGSAFISACVIDHLWHLVETGYYHRQGGPYPPYTWKIESIVKHKHQKAAYCGITFFDSDAYPAQYREKLYMGNIHGGCINVDRLKRAGATYFGEGDPDFLTANDAWFMPVVQKVGPDGCLYVLDWYDRYHCYQDANRDPAGIDRGHGRLYRVRYKDSPRAQPFDLAKETDTELTKRLASPNVFYRDLAQRLLHERSNPETAKQLAQLIEDKQAPRKARLHALWTLVAMDARAKQDLDGDFHVRLLGHDDPTFRAWAVRSIGEKHAATEAELAALQSKLGDGSRDVLLQLAIAARKIPQLDAVRVLLEVLGRSADDQILPQVVWQNLQPLLDSRLDDVITQIDRQKLAASPVFQQFAPRLVERLLALPNRGPAAVARLAGTLMSQPGPAADGVLNMLSQRVQTGELRDAALAQLREGLQPAIAATLKTNPQSSTYRSAAFLAVSWKDPAGIAAVRTIALADKTPEPQRLEALSALISAGDGEVLGMARGWLANRKSGSADFRGQVVAALGRLESDAVADTILEIYKGLDPEIQPRAVELLTQRTSWARKLLAVLGTTVPTEALNMSQVRKLLSTKDDEVVRQVTARWGSLRDGRNPQRDRVIAEMRLLVRSHPGDALKGREVHKKLCGQCHKLYGEGEEVGPDITLNGRASFEQLLSNVFDPSLVIGAAYQARTVLTKGGRTLSGLLVEDNEQRVVLKVQGGKLETIPRDDVEELVISKVSLMPEGVETQLKPQEITDLFAYLTLDRPPEDKAARLIPGTRDIEPKSSTRPEEFTDMVGYIAPGFTLNGSGEGGVALLREHRGHLTVVRTHPLSPDKPAILKGTLHLPAEKKTTLVVPVSYDRDFSDWQLVVRVNGEKVHDGLVSAKTAKDWWQDVRIDLSKFSGQSVEVELENRSNNWNFEFAYWGIMRLESE